jgi:uncharacterized protein (TIGR01777 family)
MSKKVIIAGGSGMIGGVLTQLLLEKGYEVSWLSHSGSSGPVPVHSWAPGKGELPEKEIRSSHFIINLAGAGIADQRWTAKRKEIIRSSRVDGNRAIAQLLKEDSGVVEAYLSSAAMGIYGDRGDEWCKETDRTPGDRFLVQVCRDWESAIGEVQNTGVRTVALRISVVLSNEGGALPQMTAPMKMGIASYFGWGQQYYSWIHIDDVARLFHHALENNLSGIYNAAAPDSRKMKNWVRTLADKYPGRQIVLPAPSMGLRLVFGEMADVLLNSNRLDVSKIEKEGFEWRYPELEGAAAALFSD